MRDYILTMRDGAKERWSTPVFNAWVREQSERIGHNFETRLDWEMEN